MSGEAPAVRSAVQALLVADPGLEAFCRRHATLQRLLCELRCEADDSADRIRDFEPSFFPKLRERIAMLEAWNTEVCENIADALLFDAPKGEGPQ